MKKLAVSLLALLCAALCGCSSLAGILPSGGRAPAPPAGEVQECDFRSVRVFWTEREEAVFLVKSPAELDAALRGFYGGEGFDVHNAALDAAAQEYGGSFFKQKALAVVSLCANSGSIRYTVEGFCFDGEALTVCIRRAIPEVGTCDMAWWLIFVELPAEAAAVSVVSFMMSEAD